MSEGSSGIGSLGMSQAKTGNLNVLCPLAVGRPRIGDTRARSAAHNPDVLPNDRKAGSWKHCIVSAEIALTMKVPGCAANKLALGSGIHVHQGPQLNKGE